VERFGHRATCSEAEVTRDWRPPGGPYSWPPQPPHEIVLPSVTTILSAGVPKPFLKTWGEKMVAEYAVDHVDRWNGLPRDDAIDLLKRAPRRFTGKAQERGSAVHAAIAAHVDGEEPGKLTREERGYFDAALAYLSEQRVEVVRSEACVFSREFGYAGTFDLLQRRRGSELRLVPNEPTEVPPGTWTVGEAPLEIADFKTSKRVYPEVALQLVAYARAEFIGLDDGTEEPMPSVRGGVIVQLKPNGKYNAVPVDWELASATFDTFLAAQRLHDWSRGLSRRVLGKALERAA
jgi:hypothetical protein